MRLASRRFPGHAVDFQLNIVSLESGGKIVAVFLNRIGGFVLAAKQGDARNGQGRELPCQKLWIARELRCRGQAGCRDAG